MSGLVRAARGLRSAGGLRRSAGWAVLDQCLFGFSNLLLSLLLARWLQAEQYGLFASALAALVLCGILHSALFVEPMLVLGAKLREQQEFYLRLLLAGHALFSAVSFGVCGAAALCFSWGGRSEAAGVAGALGLALPCVLAAWLLRRIFYLRSSPRVAALASALYLVLVLAGLGLARGFDLLSAAVALSIVAVTSGIASAFLLWVLPIRIFQSIEIGRARRMLREHWSFSRWLVLMTPFEWIPGNHYYLALPMIAGLGAPALLKASMNLVQPPMQIFSALRLVLTPRLADNAAAQRKDRLPLRAAAAMVGAALAWYALLFFFGGPLAQQLYASSYPEVGEMLRILGLVPVFHALGAVGSGLLRARERADEELWVSVAASLLSIGVGVPLMLEHGAIGAAYTMVLSYAMLAAGRFGLLARPQPEALRTGSNRGRHSALQSQLKSGPGPDVPIVIRAYSGPVGVGCSARRGSCSDTSRFLRAEA